MFPQPEENALNHGGVKARGVKADETLEEVEIRISYHIIEEENRSYNSLPSDSSPNTHLGTNEIKNQSLYTNSGRMKGFFTIPMRIDS